MQSRILTKIFRWSEETRTRSNHHFTFSTWRNNRQIGIKRTRRRANVENREITRGEAAELFNRTVNLIDEMERRWRERLWREAAHSDSTFKSHNYEFPANYAPRYKVRSPFRLFGKQSAKIGVYADRSIRCLPITYVGRWLGRSESAFSSTPWNTKRGERERERERERAKLLASWGTFSRKSSGLLLLTDAVNASRRGNATTQSRGFSLHCSIREWNAASRIRLRGRICLYRNDRQERNSPPLKRFWLDRDISVAKSKRYESVYGGK